MVFFFSNFCFPNENFAENGQQRKSQSLRLATLILVLVFKHKCQIVFMEYSNSILINELECSRLYSTKLFIFKNRILLWHYNKYAIYLFQTKTCHDKRNLNVFVNVLKNPIN